MVNKFTWKLAIAVAIFTITTIWWRIDYKAQLIHCQKLDEQSGGLFAAQGLESLSFVRVCVPVLIVQYLSVFFFWGGLIYYLTRPSIKEYFEKSSGKY